MKKLTFLMLTLSVFTVIAGCGSSNPEFQPDPDFKPSAEMEEMANMAQ